MPQCPACNAALKDDYGMQACPKCRAFVFVDMDGQASIGAEPSEPAAHDIAAPLSTPQNAGGGDVIDFGSSHLGDPLADFSAQAGSTEPFPTVPPSEFDSNPSSDHSDAPVDFESFSAPEPEPVYPSHRQSDEPGPPDDPLGLSAYAKSEVSQAKDGVLLLRLVISGIDTKELRESIRKAIEDSRFAWDAAATVARVERGQLMIDQLSPVKATILINRIKSLPVKIRWEQYAITQSGDI